MQLNNKRFVVSWPTLTKAITLSLVSLFIGGFVFTYLPSTLPETGLWDDAEMQQFEAIVANQATWKHGLAVLLALPAVFLCAVSLGSFQGAVMLNRVRKYTIITTVACSATISMKAEHSMTDWLGHVNYLETAHNLDCGRDVLMRCMGWTIENLRDKHGLAFMVREMQVTYQSQVRTCDTLYIHSRAVQISKSCIQLDMELFTNAPTGDRPAVKSRMVMPLVSLATGKPVRIPDWLQVGIPAAEQTG